MNSRLFKRLGMIIGLLTWGVSICVAASSPSTASPNVVVIIGDDQSWTDFGFMGHDVIETPHLDRLASESLTFTRGYVPSSLCSPSLASIITGMLPHQHKITGNEPPHASDIPEGQPGYFRQLVEMDYLINRVPTIPRLLQDKGYLSMQTGKWWQGHYGLGGFTHGMTHGDPKRGGRHGDAGLKIGREGLDPIYDFIENSGNRPFFVWYAPFLPHRPHNPPERLLKKYREKTDSLHVAKYWAMCEWFDETVGDLLGYLDRNGLSKETLVLFVSDNGWIQRRDRGGYAKKSKRSPYDGGLRTPIMARWPGQITPQEVEIPVSSIDFAPTILKATGIEVPSNMSGVNLLNLDAVRARDNVFGAVYLHNAVNIHKPAKNLKFRWCVADGRWKLILPHLPNRPNREPELYDLKKDPHEKNNLAGEHPERVRRLKAKINDWWRP